MLGLRPRALAWSALTAVMTVVTVTTGSLPAGATGEPQADLSVSVSSPGRVLVDEWVSFDIDVHNAGPDASGPIIVIIGSSGAGDPNLNTTAVGCSPSGDPLTCTWPGGLASGTTRRVTVTVRPQVTGTLSVTASAGALDAASVDPDTSNNNGTGTATVSEPQADLSVSVGSPGMVPVDEWVSFDIDVHNAGPDASGPISVIIGSSGAGDPSLNTSAVGCTLAGDPITCTWPGGLASGETRTVTVVLLPRETGLLSVTASAGATADDPSSPNNRATGTATVGEPDGTPPRVVGVADRDANAAGWYRGPVTIDWQATDPDPSSGAPTDPPDTLASTEGRDVSYRSGPSCDPAGNCATGSILLSIDTIAPTATATASPAPNANGWNSTPVTVSFEGSDGLSGIDSCDAAVVLASQGSGQSASGTCTDAAGNVSAPATAAGVNIDTTPPALTCPSPSPIFVLGATGATVSAGVSDGLSGPAAVTVSAAADTSSAGARSVSLTGEDRAGNQRTVSCSYSVAFVFDGFFSPVDGGGTLNVVAAGRAIPLKWRLTDASGAPVTDLATATVTVQSLSCSLGTSADLVEETSTGGSGLQHLGNGYYQLNWKTPRSYAGSCKTMRLDLGEGLVHTALFKFSP